MSEALEGIELIDPWDLKNKITEYLLAEQQRERSKVYSADLSPSMLTASDQGPYCDRFLGYKAVGTKQSPKFKIGTLKRFDTGKALHTLYQGYLTKIYGEDRVIHEISGGIPELQMRMKGDSQLDGKYGLEIKPISAGQYKKIVSSGKPLRTHADQVLFYFVAFGWETCTFLYFCMDGLHDWETLVMAGTELDLGDLEKTETVMRADPVRYEMYRRRILDRVLAPINQGELPIPYQGFWCRTCPYREVCLKE